jgi:hypothetical protein
MKRNPAGQRPTCDTPGCGMPIPEGGEGHPEICPACLARESIARRLEARATSEQVNADRSGVLLEYARQHYAAAVLRDEAARIRADGVPVERR